VYDRSIPLSYSSFSSGRNKTKPKKKDIETKSENESGQKTNKKSLLLGCLAVDDQLTFAAKELLALATFLATTLAVAALPDPGVRTTTQTASGIGKIRTERLVLLLIRLLLLVGLALK
jgi:hypothetical protein